MAIKSLSDLKKLQVVSPMDLAESRRILFDRDPRLRRAMAFVQSSYIKAFIARIIPNYRTNSDDRL